MRLSRYFLPILRETPKEAEIVSHRLMLRAGMMRQEAAGIYAFLPLGFRVLQKICQIVREEQNRSGAVELLMPTVQSADLWRESGRYDAYGPEMLRIKDRHERDMLYGPTNEEMITVLFRDGVKSYRDLPGWSRVLEQCGDAWRGRPGSSLDVRRLGAGFHARALITPQLLSNAVG